MKGIKRTVVGLTLGGLLLAPSVLATEKTESSVNELKDAKNLELSKVEKETMDLLNQIAGNNDELNELDKRLDSYKLKAGDQMRSYQKNGDNIIFDTLFGSESLTDLISRTVMVNRMKTETKDRADTTITALKEVKKLKSDNETKVKELETKKEDLKKEISKLDEELKTLKAESDRKAKEAEKKRNEDLLKATEIAGQQVAQQAAPQPSQAPAANPAPGSRSYGPSQAREAFNQIVKDKGLSQWEIDGWASIITRESGWQTQIWNTAGSGAYGLPQALPGSKMASHGADYMTNPYTQLSWMYDYMSSRYGSIGGAVNFWNANHWY